MSVCLPTSQTDIGSEDFVTLWQYRISPAIDAYSCAMGLVLIYCILWAQVMILSAMEFVCRGLNLMDALFITPIAMKFHHGLSYAVMLSRHGRQQSTNTYLFV